MHWTGEKSAERPLEGKKKTAQISYLRQIMRKLKNRKSRKWYQNR